MEEEEEEEEEEGEEEVSSAVKKSRVKLSLWLQLKTVSGLLSRTWTLRFEDFKFS